MFRPLCFSGIMLQNLFKHVSNNKAFRSFVDSLLPIS